MLLWWTNQTQSRYGADDVLTPPGDAGQWATPLRELFEWN